MLLTVRPRSYSYRITLSISTYWGSGSTEPENGPLRKSHLEERMKVVQRGKTGGTLGSSSLQATLGAKPRASKGFRGLRFCVLKSWCIPNSQLRPEPHVADITLVRDFGGRTAWGKEEGQASWCSGA